jgi:Xaa-Pro aminopeptidase
MSAVINKLRAKLDLSGRCALITSPVNRRYFTDFNSSDGFLLVFESESFFLTDSRFTEAAEREAKGVKVVLLEKSAEQINALLQSHGAKEVLIEADSVTVTQLRNFEKKFNGVLIDSSDKLHRAIRDLRMIKTPAEIASIRAAQRIAETALETLMKEIYPGTSDSLDSSNLLTERAAAAKLDFLMKSGGAEDVSFETIVLTGENTSMPHGVPGSRKITQGEPLLIDFGAVYGGYHSDMTRTVFIGNYTDEQKRVWEIVNEAKNRAMAAITPGVSCDEIDKIARDYITEKGYGDAFGHGLGHSVGLEIHEYPACNKSCREKLLPGMIMTIEPGIYLPGRFGVRIEDMVVITETGYENLAQTPIKLLLRSVFS